jgi:hypothetical protein
VDSLAPRQNWPRGATHDARLRDNTTREIALYSAKNGERMRALGYPDSASAGLVGCRRQFGSGAVRRVLLVNDFRDFEQEVAGGVGDDCVGEPVVYPIERTGAVLPAKLELRLAGEIMTAEAVPLPSSYMNSAAGPLSAGSSRPPIRVRGINRLATSRMAQSVDPLTH